jgi:hypothetical protein
MIEFLLPARAIYRLNQENIHELSSFFNRKTDVLEGK